MEDEKAQIVAYLRHRARRYAGALEAAPDPYDSIAATLETLGAALIECADAIERGEHRKDDEDKAEKKLRAFGVAVGVLDADKEESYPADLLAANVLLAEAREEADRLREQRDSAREEVEKLRKELAVWKRAAPFGG